MQSNPRKKRDHKHCSHQNKKEPSFASSSQTITAEITSPTIATTEQVPLEHAWSFWFDKYIGPGKTPQEYADALILVGTFDSVQVFWKWFNNLPPVSTIQTSSTLHLMKKGIRPVWEDEANIKGGHLCFKMKQDNVNNLWLQLALSVIGEQFYSYLNEEDDICGISASIRRNNEAIVQIWNKDVDLINCDSVCGLVRSIVPNHKIDAPSYRVNHV